MKEVFLTILFATRRGAGRNGTPERVDGGTRHGSGHGGETGRVSEAGYCWAAAGPVPGAFDEGRSMAAARWRRSSLSLR